MTVQAAYVIGFLVGYLFCLVVGLIADCIIKARKEAEEKKKKEHQEIIDAIHDVLRGE